MNTFVQNKIGCLGESLVKNIKKTKSKDFEDNADKLLHFIPSKKELKSFILNYGQGEMANFIHFDFEITGYEGAKGVCMMVYTNESGMADDKVYAVFDIGRNKQKLIFRDFYKDLTVDQQSEIMEILDEEISTKIGFRRRESLYQIIQSMYQRGMVNESVFNKIKKTSSTDILKGVDDILKNAGIKTYFDFLEYLRKNGVDIDKWLKPDNYHSIGEGYLALRASKYNLGNTLIELRFVKKTNRRGGFIFSLDFNNETNTMMISLWTIINSRKLCPIQLDKNFKLCPYANFYNSFHLTELTVPFMDKLIKAMKQFQENCFQIYSKDNFKFNKIKESDTYKIFSFIEEIGQKKKIEESVFNKVRNTRPVDIKKQVDNIFHIKNFKEFYDFMKKELNGRLECFTSSSKYGWDFRIRDFSSHVKFSEFAFEYEDKFENTISIWFTDKENVLIDIDEEDEISYSNKENGLVIELLLTAPGTSSDRWKCLDSNFNVIDSGNHFISIPYSKITYQFLYKLVNYIVSLKEYCRQNCWETPIIGDLDLENSTTKDLDRILMSIFSQIKKNTLGLNESLVKRVKKSTRKDLDSVLDNKLKEICLEKTYVDLVQKAQYFDLQGIEITTEDAETVLDWMQRFNYTYEESIEFVLRQIEDCLSSEFDEIKESLVRRVMKTTHKDLENLADELLDDSVDLGLSVRWCKCNLGADSPEEFGDYYGWGMTEPYKKGVDDITEDFYNQFPASKIKTDLTDETDAATIKLGKRYRMPTKEEIRELIKKCDWEWTQMNGVDGYKVMNKKDHSKFIFLPATGYLDGLSHYSVGRLGYYRSRSRGSDVGGLGLVFYSSNCGMSANSRFDGLSVRPVFNQSK